MTEPKSFKRGKHTYTKWGSNFKRVSVEGKPKEKLAEANPQNTVALRSDPQTDAGVYANASIVHQSAEEVILDFAFIPPGQRQGRIRSRVVLPFKQVHTLAALLKKTSETIQNQWS